MKTVNKVFKNSYVCLLAFFVYVLTSQAQVSAPVSQGVYGGSLGWIDIIPLNAVTSRVFVSADSANSVFYADVDHGLENPFGTNHMFHLVPDLSATANHGIPTMVAGHPASGRVFAGFNGEGLLNCGVSTGSVVTNYSGDGVEAVMVHSNLLFFVVVSGSINLHFGALDANGTFTENSASPKQISPGAGGSDVYPYLLVHPTNYHLYYLSMQEMLKSSDPVWDFSAATTASKIELPASATNWAGQKAMGISPGGRLYVGGQNMHNSQREVCFSDDDGLLWTSRTTGVAGVSLRIISTGTATAKASPIVMVYYGNAMSSDGGTNWINPNSDENAGLGCNIFMVADPLDNRIVYFQSQQGLGVSTNYGAGFRFNISRGIEAEEIYDFDVTDSREVAWTASRSGARRATSYHTSPQWTDAIGPLLHGQISAVNSVAIDPADPNGLTAYIGGQRVYKTVDGGGERGTNWVAVIPDPYLSDQTLVSSIAVNSTNGAVAVGYRFQSASSPTNKAGLFLSQDGGGTWTNLSDLFVPGGLNVSDLLFKNRSLYVAALYEPGYEAGYGIYRMTTDGTITHELTDKITIYRMSQDSSNGMYAAGYTNIVSGGTTNRAVVVYYKTTDQTAWTMLSANGLPSNNQTPSIAVGRDADSNEVPYVVGSANQIYYLQSATGTWTNPAVLTYPNGSSIRCIYWDDLVVGTTIGLYGQAINAQPVTITIADPVMVDIAGNWYVWFSGSGYQRGGPWSLGGSGTPVAGDFDGDHYADPAVVDSTGAWSVWFSSLGYQMGGPYNLSVSGNPVAADFDGDYYTDPAMENLGNWCVWFTSLGYQMGGPYNLGVSGTPVAADFDGDYYADPAVIDSTGAWYVWYTSLGYQRGGPYFLGVSGTPVAGDFDGDGYADPAMVDSTGAWRVWYTSLGYQMGGPYSLGVSGTPLAADFDGR